MDAKAFHVHHSGFRRRCTSWFSYVINSVFFGLVWTLVPVEKGFFSFFRQNKKELYPHVDFDRLRPLDFIRIISQTLFLICFVQRQERSAPIAKVLAKKVTAWAKKGSSAVFFGSTKSADKYSAFLGNISEDDSLAKRMTLWLLGFLAAIACLVCLVCITQPLELKYQWMYLSILLLIGLFFRQIHTNLSLLVLLVISLLVSSRYMWWRVNETVIVTTFWPTIFCFLLLAAEFYTYLIMVLGYFQVSDPMDRKPYPLPKDPSTWPTVDIFIPTYNEPLDVVKATVYAAKNVDWPRDKLKVWILDDGGRKEFADFAAQSKVEYLARDEHNHAKAGNINSAMKHSNGDLVAIFDCDHVPVRSFLQMTVGWLVADDKIAFVQTPHHFYSEDPFEKNLKLDKDIPSENALFHDFIQKGNDFWNAAMFCGSCAVFRRKALEEVGGIAVETVTEDAHTSLRLAGRGWKSAFISIPLAAGLSTESLSSHIGQRIRWARGMVQIFRLDNPLFKKGLSLGQRFCYLNATLYFLHGIPRIIFLLAPLPYLFADVYVIYASGLALLAYVLPHMVHSAITSQAIQHRNRNPFWSTVYEAVLSWYIVLPTTVALFAPHHGKFNVTQKGGGVVNKDFLDWTISKPYIFLILLNLAGLIWGMYRSIDASWQGTIALWINCGWAMYNLLILGAAAAVAVETSQNRKAPRIRVSVPVNLSKEDGYLFSGELLDYSKQGARVQLETKGNSYRYFQKGDEISLNIPYSREIHSFKALIRHVDDRGSVGLEFFKMDPKKEEEFCLCTFGRSDTWSRLAEKNINDSFSKGVLDLVRISSKGFYSLIEFSPWYLRGVLLMFAKFLVFIVSFSPRAVSIQGFNKND